jgi:hypothetical protein
MSWTEMFRYVAEALVVTFILAVVIMAIVHGSDGPRGPRGGGNAA